MSAQKGAVVPGEAAVVAMIGTLSVETEFLVICRVI